MTKVALGQQLIITVDNRVGALAEAAGIVADAAVNLEAACAYVIDNKGFILFVTNDNGKAKKALTAKKYNVSEEEVIIASIDNKPGTLRSLTQKIANVGIDLTLLYTSAERDSKRHRVVIVSENNKTALAALKL